MLHQNVCSSTKTSASTATPVLPNLSRRGQHSTFALIGAEAEQGCDVSGAVELAGGNRRSGAKSKDLGGCARPTEK